MNEEAYCSFCNYSTLNPVTLDIVSKSSAVDAALAAMPSIPAAAPAATVEMPLVFSAHSPVLAEMDSSTGEQWFS